MSENKYLDLNGLLYLWQKIKTGFVAKDGAKVLSTNDYTTAEKTKLAGIAANANNYSLPIASATVLGGIKIGDNLTISNGVLTANKQLTKTSELTNDSDFTTATAVANTYATKTEMATKANTADLAAIATSGSYVDLSNKPSIPSKVSVLTNDSGYQTQAQVNSLISTALTSAVVYKGSVADMTALTALTGMKAGWMYNVTATDMNYVYNGTGWDAQAPTFTITSVANSDIDTFVAG